MQQFQVLFLRHSRALMRAPENSPPNSFKEYLRSSRASFYIWSNAAAARVGILGKIWFKRSHTPLSAAMQQEDSGQGWEDGDKCS